MHIQFIFPRALHLNLTSSRRSCSGCLQSFVPYSCIPVPTPPCLKPNYIFSNDSCLSTCPAPLVVDDQDDSQYCTYPCEPFEYLYWNNSCISSCSYPLRNYTIGVDNYCSNPCGGDSTFLYWNQSCISSCHSPHSQLSWPEVKFCIYECSASQFLFWNTSCRSTCNFPLISFTVIDKKYCGNPCPSNILYWNRSCSNSCNFPLSKRIEPSNTYCDYPCNAAAGEYLYWNGTCSTSCKIPLSARDIQGNLFCIYPCNSKLNEYLKWNGECIMSCPSNLVPYKLSGLLYCTLPPPDFVFTQSESDSSIFFVQFNQVMNGTELELNSSFILSFSVLPSSSFEFQASLKTNDSLQIIITPKISIAKQTLTIIFKNFIFNYFGNGLIRTNDSVIIEPIYTQAVIQTVKEVKSTSESAMQSIGAGSLPLIILGSNPIFLWVLLNLIQIYYYLLFINVEYPLNLNSLLTLFKVGTLDFFPNVFLEVFNFDLTKFSLGSPEKFADENIDSFFLASGGTNLSVIFAFMIISMFLLFIDKFMRNLPFRLTSLARFNLNNFLRNLMALWEGLFLNINIAASLQLTNLNSSDTIYKFSAILAYIVLILSFYMVYFKYKEGKLEIKKAKQVLTRIKVPKYRTNHYLCFMQPLFDSIQKMLFSFILVFLYNYQKTQMISLVLIKFVYVYYLSRYLPFTSPISNATNIASESLYILAIIFVAVLYNMNMDPSVVEDKKLTVGYFIIGLCITTIVFTVMLMIGSGITGTIELIKTLKNVKRDKIQEKSATRGRTFKRVVKKKTFVGIKL